MGMYTGFKLDVCLNPGVDPHAILVLLKMIGKYTGHVEWPKHPLFETERFRFMLRCASAYFPEEEKESSDLAPDSNRCWRLKVSTSLKNYDQEIDKFLDWLDPYVNDISRGTDVGYQRYEESERPEKVVFQYRK